MGQQVEPLKGEIPDSYHRLVLTGRVNQICDTPTKKGNSNVETQDGKARMKKGSDLLPFLICNLRITN